MPRVPVEERRLQFVQATARVIAHDGIAAATTRRIAAEAQAPLASLHYCFRDKDELLREVYHFLSRDYAKSLPPLETAETGVEAAFRAHALRIWRRMVASPHEQVTTFELLLRRLRVDPAEADGALAMNRAMYEGWVAGTVGLLTDAARAAGEPVPANLEPITRLFIAGIDGISIQHLSDPAPERSEALVTMLVDSLVPRFVYDE